MFFNSQPSSACIHSCDEPDFFVEPTFTPGAATTLFDMTPYHTALTDQTGTDGAASSEITAVVNWFEELTARVPVP